MFFAARYRRHTQFKQGMQDTLPVSLGIAAWGLMTGVAMVQGGLSILESLLMTGVVFAGSAQLAATPLMVSGAPMWVIFLTAFCVNLRFVVFSAHLQPWMQHLPLRERLVWGYWTGDIPYVLFCKQHPHPADHPQACEQQLAYLAGSTTVMVPAWMGSSFLGVALAHTIPLSWGLGFAGTLALLGVTASMLHTPLRWLALAISGLAAVAAWSLPMRLNIVAAIVTAVLVCLLAQRLMHRLRGHRADHTEPKGH